MTPDFAKLHHFSNKLDDPMVYYPRARSANKLFCAVKAPFTIKKINFCKSLVKNILLLRL